MMPIFICIMWLHSFSSLKTKYGASQLWNFYVLYIHHLRIICNWNCMKFMCVCDKIKCSVILLRVLKCLRTPVISCYLEVHGMAVESILWHIFCLTIHVLPIFIVSYSWNSNFLITMCIVLVYLPGEEIDIVLWRYLRTLSMAPVVLCSSRICPKMPSETMAT